jgi:hypothetical protein
MSSLLTLSEVRQQVDAEFCSFCDSSAPVVERYTPRVGACQFCVDHLGTLGDQDAPLVRGRDVEVSNG